MLREDYDSLPYASLPVARARPTELAAVAALFGIAAPDPRSARVLEIGCASGGHLLPLAVRAPQASFVGFDLSPIQIDHARRRAERLGIGNVSFLCASITELGPELGQFDYVIAHGILSWVPDDVATALLRLAGSVLSPNGIAYVSYSTLPGRALEMSLGRLLALHGARSADHPSDRAKGARALLDFLARRADPPKPADKAALTAELAAIGEEDDGALFHDHMEQAQAFHVSDVIERAARQGLAYFADAQWWTGILDNAPGGAGPELAAVTDRSMRELYLDFLLMRRYRASLFHRVGHASPDEIPAPERLATLAISAPFLTEQETGPITRFVTRAGQSVQSSDKLPIAVMRSLVDLRGACVPIGDMIAEVATRLGAAEAAIRGPCLLVLRNLAIGNLVELSTEPGLWVGVPGPFPTADSLVLRESEDPGRNWVTSLRHIPVQLAPERIDLLRRLDGTRARADLAAGLSPDPKQGAMLLDAQLAWLAEMALLVA